MTLMININMRCIETAMNTIQDMMEKQININMGCIETFVPKLRKIIECDKH